MSLKKFKSSTIEDLVREIAFNIRGSLKTLKKELVFKLSLEKEEDFNKYGLRASRLEAENIG